MQNTPIKFFDTLVIGFSNLTDDTVYALEQNFGAHHYDRLNVVVRTAQGGWITDKARVTKAYQDLSAIIDSAGLCIFFAVRNLASKDLGVAPVGILEYPITPATLNGLLCC